MAKHCSHRGVLLIPGPDHMLPEACVDEKYPRYANTHTHTHTHRHTQICGKPICLPGKPWTPVGLDSLRKPSAALTVWAVCYVCPGSTAEEEEGGRLLRALTANNVLKRPPPPHSTVTTSHL